MEDVREGNISVKWLGSENEEAVCVRGIIIEVEWVISTGGGGWIKQKDINDGKVKWQETK